MCIRDRAYLVALVKHGVQGKIETPSGSFNGVMTALGATWNDEEVASVLNHVIATYSANADVRAFTASEAGGIVASLGETQPHEVSELRPNRSKE